MGYFAHLKETLLKKCQSITPSSMWPMRASPESQTRFMQSGDGHTPRSRMSLPTISSSALPLSCCAGCCLAIQAGARIGGIERGLLLLCSTAVCSRVRPPSPLTNATRACAARPPLQELILVYNQRMRFLAHTTTKTHHNRHDTTAGK